MSKPPLWEVMRAADSSCASDFNSSEARAIIAVRDWLVPEESKPNDEFCCPPVETMLWQQKMRLRALLTAEADRAERGESTTS